MNNNSTYVVYLVMIDGSRKAVHTNIKTRKEAITIGGNVYDRYYDNVEVDYVTFATTEAFNETVKLHERVKVH